MGKDDRKKRGKNDAPPSKLTKEEDAMARYVRFNCPTNTTMFEGNEVHYFSGKKAVDTLVDSKKYGAGAKNPKFPTPASAEKWLQSLLERGLFFRAKKVVLKKKDKPPPAAPPTEDEGGTKKLLLTDKAKQSPKPSPKPGKSPKGGKKASEEVTKSAEDVEEEKPAEGESDAEGKKDSEAKDSDNKKAKKKKVKLLAYDAVRQYFAADEPGDVYVWVFDPTPFYKKVIGLLMVLGTIAGCLFPLWPNWLRLGIYYLSVTGIALFGLLLGVALARTILFGIIWALTLGHHKLWVLPNLTEDVGFFESFKPFYTYEHCHIGFFGAPAKEKEKEKKGKKAKEAESEDGAKVEKSAETEKLVEGLEEATKPSTSTPTHPRKELPFTPDELPRRMATAIEELAGCSDTSTSGGDDEEKEKLLDDESGGAKEEKLGNLVHQSKELLEPEGSSNTGSRPEELQAPGSEADIQEMADSSSSSVTGGSAECSSRGSPMSSKASKEKSRLASDASSSKPATETTASNEVRQRPSKVGKKVSSHSGNGDGNGDFVMVEEEGGEVTDSGKKK